MRDWGVSSNKKIITMKITIYGISSKNNVADLQFFTLSKAKAAMILPKAKQPTKVEINFLHKSGSVISVMKGTMNSIGGSTPSPMMNNEITAIVIEELKNSKREPMITNPAHAKNTNFLL